MRKKSDRAPMPPLPADLPVERLHDTHQEIARLIAQGYEDDQIAELTGRQRCQVGSIRANPIMQEKVRRLSVERDKAVASMEARNQATASLISLTPTAVDKMADTMAGKNGASPGIQLKASTEILDRASTGSLARPTNGVSVTNNVANVFDGERLSRLKDRYEDECADDFVEISGKSLT